MDLLQEWFMPGESDLLFVGLAIIVVSFCLPWRGSKRGNGAFLAICFGIYAVCEVIISGNFCYNWSVAFAALFVGGFALSVLIGRGLRWLIRLIRKR